jgi:CelD/BcsL family acetyltransferase involved in cellulose biosynthesis
MTVQAITNLSQKSASAAPLPTNESIPTGIETEFVNPLSDPGWDRLIVSHPDYTFFHSSAWAKVLHKTYRHEPIYLRCSQRGEPLALVPMMEVRSPLTGRRGVCLPFTDFCGPLIFGQGGSALAMEKLSDLARERKWKYFEIREGKALEVSATPAVAFYGHTLDLRGSAEDLEARLKSSVRRALRKAERSGLSVQVTRTREAVLEFYRLHIQTRRRHGLPPQPVSFFLNIHDEVVKPGLGFVVLARSGSRSVAAAVFLHFGKKAVYKFGASDERVQDLRGNNLIMWEGIRFLAQNGAESLHFGRTSLENDGLRRFKLTWGTQEETLVYLKFDATARAWVGGRDTASGFHNAIFRRSPLALNRLAGAIIYPHLD